MGRKRVNRKKKIQEAGVILIAGILVIFGVFLGVKFIPKHQQENISITKPNKNEKQSPQISQGPLPSPALKIKRVKTTKFLEGSKSSCP